MNNNKTQIWRSSITTIFAIMSLPVTATAIFIAALFLGGKKAFRIIITNWIKLMFYLANINFKVTGWQELPKNIQSGKEPVIFMSNHESNLDPLVLISAIPRHVVYIAKKEIKWMIPIGWVATLADTIFIDRNNKKLALESLNHVVKEIQKGKSAVIFPEGTRTRTGELMPFKKGGFTIAQRAGVKIVPIAITGGFTILPTNSICIKCPGEYKVAFGNPIDPNYFANRELLSKEVQYSIISLKQ